MTDANRKISLILISYGFFLLTMGAIGAAAGSAISGWMGGISGLSVLLISQIRKRGIWDWIPSLLLMIVFFIRSMKTGKWAPIVLTLVSSLVFILILRQGLQGERKASQLDG